MWHRAMLCLVVWSLVVCSLGADWNQWRGANRDGSDPSPHRLMERLPDSGLQPRWQSEDIPSGGNGGWSSPVVAEGKVYLFSHYQTARQGVKLPPASYPALAEKDRQAMPKEQLDEYERNAQAEAQARRKASHDFFEAVWCFDARDGKQLWKHVEQSRLTTFFHSGTPAVVNGRLYFLGAGGVACCLDAQAGQVLWRTELPIQADEECFMSSFAVEESLATVLAGRLFGLDASDGRVVWDAGATTAGTHGSPVIWRPGGTKAAPPRVIVNTAGQETVCVDGASGKELWRMATGASLSTPVVVGDRLLTYGHERSKGLQCFALTEAGAESLWTCKAAADKGSSPVVANGYAYIQGGKRLVCVDLETGKPAWTGRVHAKNPQYSSPAAADGKLYYACGSLLWFRADPARYHLLESARINDQGLLAREETFRRLLEVESQSSGAEAVEEHLGGHGPLDCASPALSDGFIYLRLADRLACYDLRTDAATAAAAPPNSIRR